MEPEPPNPNSSRRTSAGSECAEAAKAELKNAGDKKHSEKAGDEQQSNSNQEDNDDDDKEGDDDDDDDKEKVIEKSHNERFLKKNAQILSYKVPGVNAYVSFEIKTGKEVIWNDVMCESSETKEARLLTQLKKMRRSYHPNSMRILDCWRNENRISFITERPDETYTTLRHWFNISRLSRNAMISKRLIRQVVSGLKYFSDHSLVHGNISTDSILIYGTNVKLGPFALDAFWHSHTVRKTTKKNFYLSSDWIDPAARITSLTDAYAMGVLCLEIVMWCPLDNELGEGDVDVPKYVLDKVEQFDDRMLRNFIKVCMSGNRHLGINELFDVSAFFEPPSLRHLAAKVVTDTVTSHYMCLNQTPAGSQASGVSSKQNFLVAKHTSDINAAYQQLLRHARSSFEVDSIVAQVNLKDGSTRQLLFKDVAQYYISFKFLEDIDHGYYPLIKFDQNGRAIVPAHVRRILSGDWQKEKEEKEAKEKEKAAQGSAIQTSGNSSMMDSATVHSDAKTRKESKEVAAGAASGGGAESSGAARQAGSAEKVSPPRVGASASSGAAPGGPISSSSSGGARQITASPARQQPSKLPVIDSAGVRRSTSVSGLAAGSGKKEEAGKEAGSKDGCGCGGNAALAGSGSGGHGAAQTGAGASVAGSSASAGSRGHSGPTVSTAKENKRSSASRITISAGGPSSGPGAGQGVSSSGSTGSGNPPSGHSHAGIRRTGQKALRGSTRASTGSSVGHLRRRGGSTSPMPQRVRHGVESSGRMARGGRAHGPRVRRSFNEGTTREHHRRSAQVPIDNRAQNQPERAAEAMLGTSPHDTTIGTADEPPSGKESMPGVVEMSTEHTEPAHSSDEEYEDDYDDYYEDDLEELYEEDEIEYESQFEHRGRRGQEDHMLNVTDVAPPVEKERGSAYFTDVFFEYLGLGRWLLVVKFHLLRCREDPRGNPYRELMLQLKDNEWHDVDALLDRLMCAGIVMRPEERSILRQYLDAARHNRPLRETYVQNVTAGPDPNELFERLLNVQKELQNSRKNNEEEEPGPLSDPSGQSSRHTEAWSHLRSAHQTPASVGMPPGQPHTAACRVHVPSARTDAPQRDSKTTLTIRTEPIEATTAAKDAPPAGAPEGEVEAEDEGSGKRTFACSCMPGTHSQNPLEPLNKYCPFCDRCDYLLVEGPAYLHSPCYHCRVNSAEKEGLRPEQLYRLHTQNRVPWPLFLQKYFNWPPDDPVTDAMALNECKWRSRVVCVCFHDQDTWPPCVEFPWLYNPPQGSIAYRMQVEQFSPSTQLEPMNLWCRRQSQRTDILKNISSITAMFRAGEKFPGNVVNGAATKREERDPELQARPPRRARSLTVGSEHTHWSQLFSMSIAMHHTSPGAEQPEDGARTTLRPSVQQVILPARSEDKNAVPSVTASTALLASSSKSSMGRNVSFMTDSTLAPSTLETEASDRTLSETELTNSSKSQSQMSKREQQQQPAEGPGIQKSSSARQPSPARPAQD